MLELTGVSRAFGGVVAVANVSFTVAPGELCAVIGPNGAGKTTCFNLITGVHRPDRGRVALDGVPIHGRPPHAIARLGVARTFQTLQVFGAMSVLENVMIGVTGRRRLGLVAALLGGPTTRRTEAEARGEAMRWLEAMGLADQAGRPARELAFGEQRRLELARALATAPRLLLLDEPASGLSGAEVADLVRRLRELRERGRSILLIEHNVTTVMEVADRVIVLHRGEKLTEGTPAEVQRDPRVLDAYLGEETDRAPLERRTPVGSDAVLRVEGLAVDRGGVTVLRGVDLAVREREVRAVIGPNGAGKSTLLGSLAGLLPARQGSARFRGEEVRGRGAERLSAQGLVLVPERRQVFAGLTVRENLLLGGYRRIPWLARWQPRPRALEADLQSVLALFPRLAALQGLRAGALSGGEQQMLAVGRALMGRPRLLMLDEPSLGLAPKVVAEILAVLARLRDEGTAVLLVEQNARAALRVADTVAVLGRGTIEMEGNADELARDSRVGRAYLGAAAGRPRPMTLEA